MIEEIRRYRKIFFFVYIGFVLLVITFAMYSWWIFSRQMQIELGSKARIAAISIASTLTLSEADIAYLIRLDFNSLLEDPLNLVFEERAREIMKGADIKYIYLEMPLSPDQVKYHIQPGQDEAYELPLGTALNVVYLLDAVVDDETRQADTANQGYIDQDRYTPTYPDRANLYEHPEVSVILNSDEWGEYITGYAPYYLPDGQFVGLVGVDLFLDHYNQLVRASLLQTLTYCLILCIMGFWVLRFAYNRVQANIYLDPHTGLYHRKYYLYAVDQAILADANSSGVMFDLNICQLWRLNQGLGQETIDKLLARVGRRLSIFHDKKVIVARTAMNTFGMYIHNVDPAQIQPIVRQLLDTLSKSYTIKEGVDIAVSFTCGISSYPVDAVEARELCTRAEYASLALAGRQMESIQFFDHSGYEKFQKDNRRRELLPGYIKNNSFYSVYQPIIDLVKVDVYGYEGLSRLKDDTHGSILDAINDARIMGVSETLEELMTRNVVQNFMGTGSYKTLFINRSPTSQSGDQILMDILLPLKDHAYMIEFTEHESMNYSEINHTIEVIRNLGGQIAIDDFGSGYANYAALLKINPEVIKIDQTLIRDIDRDHRKQILVANMISFAQFNGMITLAEGIETAGELQTCVELGIRLAQGFYLGRPAANLTNLDAMQIAELRRLIAQSTQSSREIKR